MAGSSLLALIDDIATILDDIALLSKVAAKKTAGVLGDDLALNAEQVAGIRAEREIPVVWAVAKGSLRNKVILVPAALLLGTVLPWAVTPLLMVGGGFLCYEGFEKIVHKLWPPTNVAEDEHLGLVQALADPEIDMVAFEQEKIRGAVRTDFVLSAEIITITLGTVAKAPFAHQALVMSTIALVMTAGVYGVVAAIVKLDDVGLYLSRTDGEGFSAGLWRGLGQIMLGAAPRLMKTLSIVGTLAMFTVGGGILVHGVHSLDQVIRYLVQVVNSLPIGGGIAAAVMPPLLSALLGLVAGALILGAVTVVVLVLRGRACGRNLCE
jgi:predicted DNA repair protein MutK